MEKEVYSSCSLFRICYAMSYNFSSSSHRLQRLPRVLTCLAHSLRRASLDPLYLLCQSNKDRDFPWDFCLDNESKHLSSGPVDFSILIWSTCSYDYIVLRIVESILGCIVVNTVEEKKEEAKEPCTGGNAVRTWAELLVSPCLLYAPLVLCLSSVSSSISVPLKVSDCTLISY